MTLKEIKAMFAPGQVWIGRRTPGFNGEACTVTKRTVTAVRGIDVIFSVDGKPNYHSSFPLASNVIEARRGYLHFNIPRVGASIELTLQ